MSRTRESQCKPLSGWIRSFPTNFGGHQLLSGDTNSTTAALPDDDYLIPALRVACSLADQICQAEEAGQSLPTPSTDWIDSIVVHSQSSNNSDDDHLDGEGKNIRVEILPSLLFNTTDDNNPRQAAVGIILYSLGIVFYEIFSRGERPAELEQKHVGERPNGPPCQNGTAELSGDLDPLPFDQGGIIDLAREINISPFNSGVDDNCELSAFDDLQDEYNDFWGNNNDGDFLQEQRPKKKVWRNNNNSIICSVSVEPLKAKGIPGPLRDLIANMLHDASGALGVEDAYRNMSDVRDDLQLMLDKPSIYLQDQDMGTLSTTGLLFGGTVFGRKAEESAIIDAYRRSMSGETELVTISGPSGTGKSLLALEFGKYVVSNGGIFLFGKFDQLQQGVISRSARWREGFLFSFRIEAKREEISSLPQ